MTINNPFYVGFSRVLCFLNITVVFALAFLKLIRLALVWLL